MGNCSLNQSGTPRAASAAQDESKINQVIMATHLPLLMAYPGARLLRLSKYGLDPVTVQETEHFRVMREFWGAPMEFFKAMLEE